MIFFVIAVVLVPHLLALLTVWHWWRWRRYRSTALLLHIIIALGMGIVAFVAFPWCYTSVYFPFVYGGVGLLGLWLPLVRQKRPASRARPTLLQVIWAAVLFAFAVSLWWSRQPPAATVNWPLPLQGDHYYTQQGGHSWLTNPFHHRYHAQSMALDIVQLNKWGNRASGFLPKSLADYEIYGDTIFSPVYGVVVRHREDWPESTPPAMDARLPLGNHLFIQKADTLVILGHLIPGSLTVNKGDTVQVGTPLGLVGNSGRTSEPHLHYQVVVQTAAGWEPIGIRWHGRYPSTGDPL